ncbi:hypothetical protein [Streptomyces sp. NPDC086023]|uniref:hypothetical protein n=1 Tax=Streptomyces sp. NPDC086023 TaxID=3365746 RepID=UPI0037D60986
MDESTVGVPGVDGATVGVPGADRTPAAGRRDEGQPATPDRPVDGGRDGGRTNRRRPVEGWLAEVWARTRLVQVLAGGEGADPLDERPLLGWIEGAGPLAELRSLSTRGRFTGGVCRCPGGFTLSLHDAGGEPLGRASLHGVDSVSWERGRFGDDLEVADPVGLALLLARHGAPGVVARFSSRLAVALGLREGRPQVRQAGPGPHGAGLLAGRGVPDALRPALAELSGLDAGRLPEARVATLRDRLVESVPDAAERTLALLSWLGRLPDPMEADFGEGLLVRALLDDTHVLPTLTAHSPPPDPNLTLALLRWAARAARAALTDPQDGATLATLAAPALRRILG